MNKNAKLPVLEVMASTDHTKFNIPQDVRRNGVDIFWNVYDHEAHMAQDDEDEIVHARGIVITTAVDEPQHDTDFAKAIAGMTYRQHFLLVCCTMTEMAETEINGATTERFALISRLKALQFWSIRFPDPDFYMRPSDSGFIYSLTFGGEYKEHQWAVETYEALTGVKIAALRCLPGNAKSDPTDYDYVDFRTGRKLRDPWNNHRRAA